MAFLEHQLGFCNIWLVYAKLYDLRQLACYSFVPMSPPHFARLAEGGKAKGTPKDTNKDNFITEIEQV
jgi:hypothetical protein